MNNTPVKMPGFTAGASVYQPTGHYFTKRSWSSSDLPLLVPAQIPRFVDPGAIDPIPQPIIPRDFPFPFPRNCFRDCISTCERLDRGCVRRGVTGNSR